MVVTLPGSPIADGLDHDPLPVTAATRRIDACALHLATNRARKSSKEFVTRRCAIDHIRSAQQRPKQWLPRLAIWCRPTPRRVPDAIKKNDGGFRMWTSVFVPTRSQLCVMVRIDLCRNEYVSKDLTCRATPAHPAAECDAGSNNRERCPDLDPCLEFECGALAGV